MYNKCRALYTIVDLLPFAWTLPCILGILNTPLLDVSTINMRFQQICILQNWSCVLWGISFKNVWTETIREVEVRSVSDHVGNNRNLIVMKYQRYIQKSNKCTNELIALKTSPCIFVVEIFSHEIFRGRTEIAM